MMAELIIAYNFPVVRFTMARSKKDPYPTHRENFCRPERGGRDCLKNALNLYRMSGEGGIANFLRGGGMDFAGTTQYMPSQIV